MIADYVYPSVGVDYQQIYDSFHVFAFKVYRHLIQLEYYLMICFSYGDNIRHGSQRKDQLLAQKNSLRCTSKTAQFIHCQAFSLKRDSGQYFNRMSNHQTRIYEHSSVFPPPVTNRYESWCKTGRGFLQNFSCLDGLIVFPYQPTVHCIRVVAYRTTSYRPRLLITPKFQKKHQQIKRRTL